MSKFVDLTGQKFNHLTPIKYLGEMKWLCRCDCGNETIVRTQNLKRNISKSCGCLAKKNAFKHGLHQTRLYRIWAHMKERCYSSTCIDYKNYGGRGITICKEWLSDFKIFYKWAYDNGYTDNLTIDRINNNKGYCPTNCRWVDKTIQANNTRQNHYITYKNKTQSLADWAREYNINQGTLYSRIGVLNWSIERALLTPVRKQKHS